MSILKKFASFIKSEKTKKNVAKISTNDLLFNKSKDWKIIRINNIEINIQPGFKPNRNFQLSSYLIDIDYCTKKISELCGKYYLIQESVDLVKSNKYGDYLKIRISDVETNSKNDSPTETIPYDIREEIIKDFKSKFKEYSFNIDEFNAYLHFELFLPKNTSEIKTSHKISQIEDF